MYKRKPKTIVKCLKCGTNFSTSHYQAKFCSNICRSHFHLKRTGRQGIPGVPNGTVGAITEMRVASYFMQKGYNVFRSLSPSCFCDLIAIKDKEILKIEARTAYLSEHGTLSFPKKTKGNIDIFGLYIANKDEIRIVPYSQQL